MQDDAAMQEASGTIRGGGLNEEEVLMRSQGAGHHVTPLLSFSSPSALHPSSGTASLEMLVQNGGAYDRSLSLAQ